MSDHQPTIFDKILAGEIPSYKVYEDDHVFAFLDIGPLSDGHTLVIPKERGPSFTSSRTNRRPPSAAPCRGSAAR